MTSQPDVVDEQPNSWTQGGQAKSSDVAPTMAKALAVTTDTADLGQALPVLTPLDFGHGSIGVTGDR